MGKCTTTISVDCDVLQQARNRKLNISNASQDGLEQALNLPFTLEDLQREKLQLVQKLRTVEDRINELSEIAEYEKERVLKEHNQVGDSIKLIIQRHDEQPPVPEIVWEKQAKLCNVTIDELQLLVNKKLLSIGREQIER